MKKSKTIDLVKSKMGVRLTYVINGLSGDLSNKEMARFLDISLSTLYKIKKGNYEKISVNLLLNAVERLGIHYKMAIRFNGKTREINITEMESVAGAKYNLERRGGSIFIRRIV